MSRCGGPPEKLAAMGPAAFTAAVRGALGGWGGQRVAGQVCRAVFAALTDTEGVIITHRRGLLRRCAGELGDLQRVRAQLRETEAEMAAVLGELGLSRLGDIPGLTVAGAAAVLAETGDPRRYDSSSSLARHAGLSPAENASGAFEGQARISRRGRPGLRLAVWRAVWPLLIHNPVMAAKYAAMTAADAAAQASSGGDHGRPAQRPRPARGARRPESRAPPRCCAGSTPWSSTAPAGTPPSPAAPPVARRRPPDQRFTACARTGALDLLPDEGTASPQTRRGPASQITLGSRPLVARTFSPARLNAVGAGPPAPAGGPSPLALRRARRPG